MSALRAFERAWAEPLFAAIIGPTEEHGLPSFESIDHSSFYRAIDSAPGPAFAPGLRAIVYALTFLPAADLRFRKPFFALDADARLRCIDAFASDERYVVRQMLSTLKILACFAYFEDPRVRARSRRALP
jgi:hypothetical protein